MLRLNLTIKALLICLALTCLACNRSPLGDDLTDARRAMAVLDWQSAEKYLERYLRSQTDPELRWQAWKEMLEVSRNSKHGKDWTIDYLETMYIEYETHPTRAGTVLRQLGSAYEQQGNLERAAQYYTLLIEIPDISPLENVELHRRIANYNIKLRRLDIAEDVLQNCIALVAPEPKIAECMFDLADLASMREHLDESQRLAQQVLHLENISPTLSSRASFILADILEQKGQLKEALQLFESIKTTYPNLDVVQTRINYLKKKIK